MTGTRNTRVQKEKLSDTRENTHEHENHALILIPPNVALSDVAILRRERGKFVVTHTWRPYVEKYYSVPDAPIGHRKIYTIRVDEQVQEITDAELADGSVWTKFTNVSNVHGRANRDLLANIVTYLAVKECRASRGYARIGWNRDASNKYVYVLEDGRDLYGDTHYVVSTKKEVTEKGHNRMPDLPMPAIELTEAHELIDRLELTSINGHQLMCVAAIFRSYLHDIVPAYTSLMIYGASRIGKTTIALAGCNLSFPTYYKDKPHASFQDTPASVETKIARQKSANCLIDDLMLPPTATEKDVRDKAAILEMIVRTTANGSEARARMRRDMTPADAHTFDVLPIITGETIPPVLASLERRMISIPIFPGDIDLDAYKLTMYPQDAPISAKWETGTAADMLRLGHMALRSIQDALNEDNTSMRYAIEQYEKAIEETLRTELYNKIGRDISQLCEDIPQTYAKLHAGLYTLGRYAFNAQVGEAWSNKLLPYSLHFMEQQINKMEGYNQNFSIEKLTSMYRDRVAENHRMVNGEHHRFANNDKQKSEPQAPDRYNLEKEFWGLHSFPQDRVIAAYTHTIHGTPVYYPQEAYYQALLDIARHTVGYERFKTEQDIIDAYIKAGWVQRTDEQSKQHKVRMRIAGRPPARYLELKLERYITCGDETKESEYEL